MTRVRECRAPSPTRRWREVVVRTLEEVPEGATHWSKRELAGRVGISPSSVLRIWRAFGLQPSRSCRIRTGHPRAASPEPCHHRAHPAVPGSSSAPSAAPPDTASRSRSMFSSPRTMFRFASGNDVHSAVSGILFTTATCGQFPRPHCPRRPACPRIACPQSPSPLHQPEQTLPAENRRADARLANDPRTMASRLKASSPASSAGRWLTSPSPASPTDCRPSNTA